MVAINLNLLALAHHLCKLISPMLGLLLIFLLINIKTMPQQAITFEQAISEFYLNIPIKGHSADSVIAKFKQKADSSHVSRRLQSLGVNIEMSTDGIATRVTHVFVFNKIEFFSTKLESCKIEIDMGEIRELRKILDIRWVTKFNNEQQASLFFKKVKDIFMSISTMHKIEEDKWNSGIFAQFSSHESGNTGIKDITFFYGKSATNGLYEVSLSPYNELINE
ncbi:MAG: hypothetical protein KF746_03135 [Chitinophagaceae bacterium]|nr:hypothetical protein [Chitinophagaceae bacterium]